MQYTGLEQKSGHSEKEYHHYLFYVRLLSIKNNALGFVSKE